MDPIKLFVLNAIKTKNKKKTKILLNPTYSLIEQIVWF